MNLADLLRPLDLIFKKCRARYAVIGGYAVAAWGEERATRDIDLLCNVGHTKALLDALNSEHIRFKHRIGDYDDPIPEAIQIEMGAVMGHSKRTSLLGYAMRHTAYLIASRTVTVEGLDIPVVSPEDLVILKLLAGSARDLEDAKSVIHVQGDKLDLALIRQFCPEHLRQNLRQLLDS